MKKRNHLLWIILPLLSFTGLNLQAQNQKLGHLNSVDLFMALPDWKVAEQNLETYAVQLQKKLTDEEQLLMEEFEVFRRAVAEGGVKPIDAKAKETEFQERNAALQQKRKDAQQSLAEKENELFLPIKENVNKTIQEFMAEENYAYIFDTASGSVAIGPLGEDVTDKIKTRLGL